MGRGGGGGVEQSLDVDNKTRMWEGSLAEGVGKGGGGRSCPVLHESILHYLICIPV